MRLAQRAAFFNVWEFAFHGRHASGAGVFGGKVISIM